MFLSIKRLCAAATLGLVGIGGLFGLPGWTTPLSTAAAFSDLPDQTQYSGLFNDIDASDVTCSTIFSPAEYKVDHFRVGPTRRTSVLFFSGADPDAFFHQKSWYGRLGGSNDLYYEQQMARDGVNYMIKASGLIDVDVVYLEITVEGKDSEANEICKATATFAAYNRF